MDIKLPDLPNLDKIFATPKLNLPNVTNGNLASEFHKRLVNMINDFDAELDQEHEVGIRLVSFGQTIQFHVQDIGYYNPSLIRFYGAQDDGNKIELIQHVSQISFLLMAVKRLNPEEPKRLIGYKIEGEVKED